MQRASQDPSVKKRNATATCPYGYCQLSRFGTLEPNRCGFVRQFSVLRTTRLITATVDADSE